jgi:hypothetical protein
MNRCKSAAGSRVASGVLPRQHVGGWDVGGWDVSRAASRCEGRGATAPLQGADPPADRPAAAPQHQWLRLTQLGRLLHYMRLHPRATCQPLLLMLPMALSVTTLLWVCAVLCRAVLCCGVVGSGSCCAAG